MEYDDLSSYTHAAAYVHPGVLNFGWIGDGFEVRRSASVDHLAQHLVRYLPYRVARTRGLHLCPFCPPPEQEAGDDAIWGMLERPVAQEVAGELLGSAEIRVPGSNGRVYAAPDLVVHYVAVHGYCPPEEVVHAILSGPAPGTDEYRRAVEHCVPPEDITGW